MPHSRDDPDEGKPRDEGKQTAKRGRQEPFNREPKIGDGHFSILSGSRRSIVFSASVDALAGVSAGSCPALIGTVSAPRWGGGVLGGEQFAVNKAGQHLFGFGFAKAGAGGVIVHLGAFGGCHWVSSFLGRLSAVGGWFPCWLAIIGR